MRGYLKTLGRKSVAIAYCDRCRMKHSIEELRPDPDQPGLMVCMRDTDVIDQHKLPAREPDTVVLPFVRPDSELSPEERAGILTEDGDWYIVDEFGHWVIP